VPDQEDSFLYLEVSSMMWLVNLLRATPASRKPSHRHTGSPSSRSHLTVEGLEDRLTPSGVSSIVSNFNGTAIPAGDTVWFNSVAKVSGLGSAPVTLHVVNATINFSASGTPYQLAVPDAAITFSPTATTATTTFDVGSNSWTTTVPSNPGGNVFLAGLGLPVPNGLRGGINPVTWTATFQTDTSGVSVNWQWAAAVYTSFSTDYPSLNVKPVDSNQLSVYKNSDHAGTPEAFKSSVVGGARGGGGSNWTGSYSGTGKVTPDLVTAPQVQQSVNLSGSVVDQNNFGVQGVVLTLTGKDVNGNAVSLTATTDDTGSYTIPDVPLGSNYTLTESSSISYIPNGATAGTVNGFTDGTATSSTTIGQIDLTSGSNGNGYNFTVLTTGGV
jgi:hypothetical protein